MFDYRFTVVAPLLHGEPSRIRLPRERSLTLVSQFTNPRPPAQNWIAPTQAEDLALIEAAN
jgi:hypothetical protein